MNIVKALTIFVLLMSLASAAFIYSGVYPIAADVPHNKLTYWLLETLRERSIARASKMIAVPELNDSELLLSGGPDYNDMCAGCHLKPGSHDSDIRAGLYPKPPNLTDRENDGDEQGDAQQIARHRFWIIKHGVKASGMPAWGLTHDDKRIWAMVAFLQKLPELTPEQYQIITARGDTEPMHH